MVDVAQRFEIIYKWVDAVASTVIVAGGPGTPGAAERRSVICSSQTPIGDDHAVIRQFQLPEKSEGR